MHPTPSPSISRRRFASGMAAGATAVALAGCSSGGTSKDPKTLQVWGGVPPENGPQALIDNFLRTSPGFDVRYTRFVNDDRGNVKVNTALQGDIDIDVYFTYTVEDLAMRSGSGLAADMGDRVRSTPELDVFLDTDEPKALFDGDRITALATAREPYMILFNEALREDAGIELPTEWDLDGFLDVIRTLTTDDRYGSYILPDLARIKLGPNYRYTADGNSNFSDPAFLDLFTQSADLIEEKTIFPWSQVLARHLDAYQQNYFIGQDFATWYTAPFNLRFLNDSEQYPHDFKVSAAPVPTYEGENWNTGAYNNFIQINAKSPKQDMAWELVRYWLTDGAQDMAPGGKIPTIDTVDHDEMLSAILGEKQDTFFDVDSFRRVLFDDDPKLYVDTNLTAVAEITQKYEQQRDVCWLLEKSPEQAIETVDSNAQALIDRYEEA